MLSDIVLEIFFNGSYQINIEHELITSISIFSFTMSVYAYTVIRLAVNLTFPFHLTASISISISMYLHLYMHACMYTCWYVCMYAGTNLYT